MINTEHEPQNNIDLYLVNVPVGITYMPSLALGILKAAAKQAGIATKVLYANVLMADCIGMDRYIDLTNIANSTIQLIEILFQPYAGYQDYASMDEIEAFIKHSDPNLYESFPVIRRTIEAVWEKMDEYLDKTIETILQSNPKAVGCSYGFQQANACFAILKRIKERRPEVITFMGGSSCSEYAGQAIVDHRDFVDYVFCGETDDIFAPAINLMLQGDKKLVNMTYPSVLIEGGTPASHALSDLKDIPYPDYDDYFEQIRAAGIDNRLEVQILFESSRGCWWGCRHRCRFCGLHSDAVTIEYRKKEVDRIIDELDYLHDRYQSRHFFFCDCILDYETFGDMLHRLQGRDYRLSAEVKTNMTRAQIKALSDAGFKWIQPGMEAIQDDLLMHMNKGNRAIKHVEYLKWATCYGVYCFWNLITGFPKEKTEWFDETIGRMKYISHLIPPNRNTLIYQRNSYYTTHAREYDISLSPAEFYSFYFGKDQAFTDRFAEYFTGAPCERPYLERLDRGLLAWQQEFNNHAALTYFVDGFFLGIYDSRSCTQQSRIVLDGLKKEICLQAESAISIDKLVEQLKDYERAEIEEAITQLYEDDMVIEKIGNEILFLAIPREEFKQYPMEEYYGNIV